MKIFILILSFTYANAQTDTTQWETIRGLIGAADTCWKEGAIHTVNDSMSLQFRTNGAVIQRREFWYKKD